MHLINIHSLKLEEFVEGSIPGYAILSHRWTDEELTFKEVAKNRVDKTKKGYEKLIKTCEIAATHTVNYVWIDTCCIDKRSSAELSEAINSMYAWYAMSWVCIAALQDVKSGPHLVNNFKKSVWFTRAWTLQELLAPGVVEFYDGNWVHFGSKRSYASIIQEVTGIPEFVLEKGYLARTYSIAERMSWAAGRTATRSEDVAYSLMGLFGVNMALLYGEGSKAFLRLQEEIIRRTDDTTFLFWRQRNDLHTLLANSPTDFQDCRKTRIYSNSLGFQRTLGILNIGLEIEAQIVRWAPNVYGLCIAATHNLDEYDLHETNPTICVLLVRQTSNSNFNTFFKLGVTKWRPETRISWSETRKLVVLWRNDRPFDTPDGARSERKIPFGFSVQLHGRFQIHVFKLKNEGCTSVEQRHNTLSDRQVEVEFDEPTQPEAVKVVYKISASKGLVIYLFFDFESRACALVCNEINEPDDTRLIEYIRKPRSNVETNNEEAIVRTRKFLGKDIYSVCYPDWQGEAEIPRGILATKHQLQLELVPPSRRSVHQKFWELTVSEDSS